ncbi:putative outer membrane starch-binding protein [Dyadobacter jejuensis]|uniref:Putative outer membrane starch-binding protein n=1 Tax=Dyadobacter jejuensis TaxID=1082580 RepID=A0A316ABP5_9BACT|nr:RagB/SusD family nutrient uptake outer membrane protein [Dyadobacter jejuensis]PWJ55002.1 putative outer membrane starch-binding protein [Dyadobacter jejuensis]
MKMKLKIYIGLALVLVQLSGCNQYLTEVNPNEMSTGSFWKNLDDANSGLTAVYNSFKNPQILAFQEEYNRSDMTYPGYGRPTNTDVYYLQTFNNGSPAPNNKWTTLYTGIFRANQVLESLDKLLPTYSDSVSIKRGRAIKAQAHFFRGLFYSYLHNSFNQGSVPIFDFVPQGESQFYQDLQPSDIVLDFYRKDLEYAKANLPAKWTNAMDLGRVTSGAATAVLGMSYLYEKNYDKAASYFKDVIENPSYGYKLTPSIGDNFSTKAEFNEESILEIGYSIDYKAQVGPWAEEQVASNYNVFISPVGGNRAIYPSCWLIMAYKKEEMDKNDARNYVVDPSGTKRLRTYSLRTSYSIVVPDDIDMPYYQLLPAQAANFNGGATGYFRKYTNWETLRSEKDIVPNQRSGINVRVIRLADVYLMYAECLIKGGTDESGVNGALQYINKVRHRSALKLLGQASDSEFPAAEHDNKVYTASAIMEHLMYVERPLELSLEGHAIRHLDLRRWGITKQRFEEVSKKQYFGDIYWYTNVAGKKAFQWTSILKEGTNPSYTTLQDNVQAAKNYIASEHAYWPLPNNEILTNPVVLK